MFKEKCFVVERVSDRQDKVLFDTAKEAAEYIGMSPQYMRMCKKENRRCGEFCIVGWKSRFYLVGTKMGTFELCKVSGGRFCVVGKQVFIEFKDTRVVKDATELCISDRG